MCFRGPEEHQTRVYARKAAGRLTVRVQEFGDPQLALSDPEGLLQVLLVASGSGFRQVHHLGPQRVQDGEEDHAAPPAGFKILDVQRAAGSEGNGRGLNRGTRPAGPTAARRPPTCGTAPGPTAAGLSWPRL